MGLTSSLLSTLCFLLPLSAIASELSLSAIGAEVSTEPENQWAIVQFSPMPEIHGQWISSATLTIPVDEQYVGPVLPIAVHGRRVGYQTLIADAEQSASSVELGIPAGNEPDLTPGSVEIRVDVTDIVRGIAAGAELQRGFVITASGPLAVEGGRVAGLSGLDSSRLDVRYRKFTDLFPRSPRAMIASKEATPVGDR